MAVGTTAALIGGSLASSVVGASSASKAAKAQTQAAQQDLALQKEIYEQQRTDLAPWRDSGSLAQSAAMSMLGLGSAPIVGGTAPTIETVTTPAQAATYGWKKGTGLGRGDGYFSYTGVGGTPASTSYKVGGQTFADLDQAQAYANANKTGGTAWNWQMDPAYQFRLQQGLDAIQASAAARGGLYSGKTMRDLNSYGQDYASNEWGNTYNRVMGQSSLGQNAAAMTGQAAQNYGQGASNAFSAIGNAGAAKYTGQANAFNSGLQNALGIWQYQNMLKMV